MSPEERVLVRLVGALLFEKLVPQIRSADAARGGRRVTFQVGLRRYHCRARIGAFGRVRVQGGSVRVLSRKGTDGLVRWQDVVEQLVVEPAVRSALYEELTNTVRLCRWNELHVREWRGPRRDLCHAQLEGAIDEGHPYHPCFKARTGFTTDDHARYGPEAAASFSLQWIAVRRRSVWADVPGDLTAFWRRELGGDAQAHLEAALVRAAVLSRDYTLMPLHPWQWDRLRGDGLGSALRAKKVIELGPAGADYRATQSVRTVMNTMRPGSADVKLPMAFRNTSELRVMNPVFLRAAPTVSRWLRRVLASEPSNTPASRVVLLEEYAALDFEPRLDGSKTPLDGHVGVLFRQNVRAHLHPSESAIPFNALALVESDGRPFIEPWVLRYGVRPWLRGLVEAAVVPVWHLLSAHGIALEAHGQNMVLIHREGWPVRVALRDFSDSVEYVDDYLARPELLPDLSEVHPAYRAAPPGRYHRMASVAELLQLVTDALFVYNLADLSFVLQEHYGLCEGEFWRLVGARLAVHAASGEVANDRIERLCYDRCWLPAESLFARRLRGGQAAPIWHWVPNALYQGGVS